MGLYDPFGHLKNTSYVQKKGWESNWLTHSQLLARLKSESKYKTTEEGEESGHTP